MKRTHVFLPEPLLKQLRAKAQSSDLSVAEIIRSAVTAYLTAENAHKNIGSVVAKLRELGVEGPIRADLGSGALKALRGRS